MRNYSHYEILEDGPTTSRIIQHSKYFGITFKQHHFRRYLPPSEFTMASDKPFPSIRTQASRRGRTVACTAAWT